MRLRPIAPEFDMVERFGKSGYAIGELQYSNEGYGTIRLVQDLSTVPTMHSQEFRYAGAGRMRLMHSATLDSALRLQGRPLGLRGWHCVGDSCVCRLCRAQACDGMCQLTCQLTLCPGTSRFRSLHALHCLLVHAQCSHSFLNAW